MGEVRDEKAVFELKKESNNESSFHCHLCDRAFYSEVKLNKHVMKHTNRYSCDQCDKSFQAKSTLRLHNNIHLAEKPYKCQLCGKEFSQAGNLKTHNTRNHGDTSVVVSSETLVESTKENRCTHCEETFEDTYQFNSH